MPISPEHIPTVDKVNAYLSKRAQGDLCADVINCNSWPAEAFLMEDLLCLINDEAPLPEATRAQTRLYLRAVSWFTYPDYSDLELMERVDHSDVLSGEDRALLHQALAAHLKDEALEPATQRVDALYGEAWKELQASGRAHTLSWQQLENTGLPEDVTLAKERVNALRPIRDAIYFRRHLAHWLAWSAK